MQHYCFWEYAGCIAFWQANRSSRGPIRMQTSGISKLHTGRLQVGYNVGMMQIGGDFSFLDVGHADFGGSSYAALLDRCGAGFPVTLLSSGRAAYAHVWLNLKQLRPELRNVLAPSYLCYSMLDPIKRAGADISFYRVKADLALDVDHLMRCAEMIARASSYESLLVLACNYFGFPESDETLSAAAALRQAGAAVLYDATHRALYPPTPLPAPSLAAAVLAAGTDPFDVCVMSLRKSLPVVDGAVVMWLNGKPPAIQPREWKQGSFYAARAQAMLLKAAYLSDGFGDPSAYSMLFAQAEAALDHAFSPMSAMSPVSRAILRRVNVNHAIHARRANYAALLGELHGRPEPSLQPLQALQPLLPSLPTDAVPLGFPILVSGDRDAALSQLAAAGVHAEVYWHLPPDVAAAQFPESARLASHVLVLPCDQRYTPDHMSVVAKAARALTA